MTTNTLKVLRGLETNRLGRTPLVGELLWTTDTKLLYAGDGSTAGGNLVRATDYVDLLTDQNVKGVKQFQNTEVSSGTEPVTEIVRGATTTFTYDSRYTMVLASADHFVGLSFIQDKATSPPNTDISWGSSTNNWKAGIAYSNNLDFLNIWSGTSLVMTGYDSGTWTQPKAYMGDWLGANVQQEGANASARLNAVEYPLHIFGEVATLGEIARFEARGTNNGYLGIFSTLNKWAGVNLNGLAAGSAGGGIYYADGTLGEYMQVWSNGGQINLHSLQSATPRDISFNTNLGEVGRFDYSASLWDFQDNAGNFGGTLTVGNTLLTVDDLFGLEALTATTCGVRFSAGGLFYYDRSLSKFFLGTNGDDFEFDNAGSFLATGSVTANGSVYAGNTVLTVDDQFYMGTLSATLPVLNFDNLDNIYYDRASDKFVFQIGGNPKMELTDTSLNCFDNVGIGTTAPLVELEVQNAGSPHVRGWTPATQTGLIVGRNNASALTIAAINTSSSRLQFGDGDDEDVGRVQYDHANNSMAFWTNAAERMRIDSAGNVGIGTSAPDVLLDVEISSTGRAWTPSSINAIHVERSLACSIDITSGNASYGSVDFSDTDAAIRGYLRYDHSDNSLAIKVNNAERMRIDSAGETSFTERVSAKAFIAPYCEFTMNASSDMGGVNGTVTYVTWSGAEVHKDTGFTHSTSTNAKRVQVDETGRYEVKCIIGLDNTGANRVSFMTHYRINGTTSVLRGRQVSYSRGLIYNTRVNVGLNVEMDLTAGDYIEIGVTVDDTDATYVVNSSVAETQFIMRRIG